MSSEYTKEEIIALRQLRKRLSDILPNSDEITKQDINLIRWLRARDLDIDKAEDMFRKSVQWRMENNIDQINDSGLDPWLVKLFKVYYDGVDKYGCIVLILPMGDWDFRGFVEKESPEKFCDYCIQVLEDISKKTKDMATADGYRRSCLLRYTVICDYAGFSFWQLANLKAVQAVLKIVGTYETHYPETIQAGYVINASSVFNLLYSLMKPLMSQRTINKINILPSDRKRWQPELLKAIDPSQLRPRFGGTKPDF